MKILVVDDNDFVREVLTRILEAEDHEVSASYDGADAIAKLDSDPYDLVITDVFMPKENGVSVAEHAKNISNTIAVLAISSYPDEEGRSTRDFVSYFADDTLSKPIKKAELLESMKRISDGVKASAALENL